MNLNSVAQESWSQVTSELSLRPWLKFDPKKNWRIAISPASAQDEEISSIFEDLNKLDTAYLDEKISQRQLLIAKAGTLEYYKHFLYLSFESVEFNTVVQFFLLFNQTFNEVFGNTFGVHLTTEFLPAPGSLHFQIQFIHLSAEHLISFCEALQISLNTFPI